MVFLICGPKLATCGIVISIWGVTMLVMLGILHITHSVMLIDGLSMKEEDIWGDTNPPEKVYRVYDQVAYNCFVAACIYMLLGAFSFCQFKLNERKEHLVQ